MGIGRNANSFLLVVVMILTVLSYSVNSQAPPPCQGEAAFCSRARGRQCCAGFTCLALRYLPVNKCVRQCIFVGQSCGNGLMCVPVSGSGLLRCACGPEDTPCAGVGRTGPLEQNCCRGLSCQLVGSSHRCKPCLKLGDSCHMGECCRGLWCTHDAGPHDGKCEPCVKLGGPCTFPEECCDGLDCGGDGKCERK